MIGRPAVTASAADGEDIECTRSRLTA